MDVLFHKRESWLLIIHLGESKRTPLDIKHDKGACCWSACCSKGSDWPMTKRAEDWKHGLVDTMLRQMSFVWTSWNPLCEQYSDFANDMMEELQDQKSWGFRTKLQIESHMNPISVSALNKPCMVSLAVHLETLDLIPLDLWFIENRCVDQPKPIVIPYQCAP